MLVSGARLSFGIKTTPVGMGYDQICRLWQRADAVAEIDHAWLWDHLQPMRGDLAAPVFEGWTLLAALAAQTRRIRLGLLVTNNLIRHPAVLAKIAATVDVISGGRLILGLGAGGNLGPESAAYGLMQPPLSERIERLNEACELVDRLWTAGEPVDYNGCHYQVRSARCQPRPVQRSRPAILIGGVGEHRLLRSVAQHADIWNAPGPPYLTVADYAHKNKILDQHCADLGRPPGKIVRSVQLIADLERPTRTVGQIAELFEAGASHFVLTVPPTAQHDTIDELVDTVITPAATLVDDSAVG
jgi:alkanesulfonate monooxygenase SsuD/methylene tetrahydromethanopterin reductase-like flavin-dependent oxidoreductase (luciferase family)